MALTLGKKIGETIVVRPDNDSEQEIKIRISDVIGNSIRVSIDAPQSTRIWREEIAE